MNSRVAKKYKRLSVGYVKHEAALFIPHALVRELDAEKEAADTAYRAKAAAEIEEARSRQVGSRTEQSSAVRPVFEEPYKDASRRHQLLRQEDIEKLVAICERGDSDSRDRNKRIVKAVRAKGQFRRLEVLPAGWREDLRMLDRRFPNFKEVTAYVARSFALSEAGDRTVRFTPIALDGPPGCGKSMYAEALANLLGVPWRRVNAEALQDGSSLTGSADFWVNSKPGIVFDLLVDSEVATPLIFVDELDKAGGDPRFDPRAGLYALLEQGTAKSFRDLSVPALSFDASRVLWIVTSNYYSRIPAPIRSRLRVFRIPAPTREQGRKIATNVYATVLRQTGVRRFSRLPEEVTEHVAQLAPRQMRAALQEAIGSAVYCRRRKLSLSDFPGAAPVHQSLSELVGIPLQPKMVVFLDLLGVLHPHVAEDCSQLDEEIKSGEPSKFEYAAELEKALGGRREVELVLTTQSPSHIRRSFLQLVMGGALADRVIGGTPDLPVPTALRVSAYIAAKGVTRWIAIHDERDRWPVEMQDRVVVTDHRQGLGTPGALARLNELLARYGDH